MAAEFAEPGEGSGRRPPPDQAQPRVTPPTRQGQPMNGRSPRGGAPGPGPRRAPDRPGRARRAVAAVARRGAGRRTRVAVARACRSRAARSACSASSACRSARSCRTTCCTSTRSAATWPGWPRVERDGLRDEWTIVELDAIDRATAGDVRFRLVQHLLRDGSKRGALRFHVACADDGGNVELFMQAGFVRYGEESILFRPPDQPACRSRSAEADAADARHPAAVPLDALRLSQLYRRSHAAAGRAPRGLSAARLGAPGQPLARAALVADADPALRRRRGFVQEDPAGPPRPGQPRRLRQIGVAKEDQPHYLRVIARRTRPDRAHRLRPAAIAEQAARRPERWRALMATTAASSAPCAPTSRRSIGGSRSTASNASPPCRC